MKIDMTSRGVSLSENELAQFETEIGHELPNDYRTFLLEYNGGEPSPYHFDVPSWEFNCSLIQELKGIDANYIDIDLRESYSMKHDILPNGVIIIGSDPGGNAILISLSGENRGKIYFWDHELQPQDQLPNLEDYKNIHFLADSFEKFIHSLKSDDEMDWD